MWFCLFNIYQIKLDIENFEKEGTETEEQRRVILVALEKEQNISSKGADESIEHHKGVSKILDQLRDGECWKRLMKIWGPIHVFYLIFCLKCYFSRTNVNPPSDNIITLPNMPFGTQSFSKF